MTTLREIVKDRRVYSIDAGKTVLEAARYMMERGDWTGANNSRPSLMRMCWPSKSTVLPARRSL